MPPPARGPHELLRRVEQLSLQLSCTTTMSAYMLNTLRLIVHRRHLRGIQ